MSITNPVLAEKNARRNAELKAYEENIDKCVQKRMQAKIDGDCLAYEAFTMLIDKLTKDKKIRANYWAFDDDGVTQVGV